MWSVVDRNNIIMQHMTVLNQKGGKEIINFEITQKKGG